MGAVFRYELIARVARACDGQDVAFLAFGFEPEAGLRLVFDGEPGDVGQVVRGLKVGTTRFAQRWGMSANLGEHARCDAPDVAAAVVWAHQAPADARGPLATPWSSHRDLMGFRYGHLFDVRPVRERVDARDIHERLGGEPLPRGWPPDPVGPTEVSALLRLAAGVLGVLPADRRCFRMFVHLARLRGVSAATTARALDLTERRVRQLRAEPEPYLGLALAAMGHPSLSVMP